MKVELCAASLKAIELAKKYGFDRVELCQALELGGLTPTHGLVQQALQIGKSEIHILIRSRAGNFSYSSSELESMLLEIHLLNQLPVQGFVVGALDENRKLNVSWLQEAKKLAPKLQWTCHRAFDDLIDWQTGMEQLIELGFTRILSSGLKPTVSEGIETLIEMSKRSEKRIELMCGGGITKDNVKMVIERVKPNAIHFSGTLERKTDSTSLFGEKLLIVSEEKISEIISQL